MTRHNKYHGNLLVINSSENKRMRKMITSALVVNINSHDDTKLITR